MPPKQDTLAESASPRNGLSRTRLQYAEDPQPFFQTDIPYREGRIRAVERKPCTWRTVYSVVLDEVVDFVPGDSVGLLVPNRESLVDDLFALCGFEDDPVSISRSGRHGFRYSGTLRGFFRDHFEFCALPRKAFLRALARTSPRPGELERLCTREASDEYFAMTGNGRTLVDILRSFECRPGLDVLVEHCELIRPRFFSLTNRRGDRAEILVGVLPGGHVSDFVGRCRPGDPVRWYAKPNLLMRITGAERLLCICTGTGIAPFLSFLRNRAKGQAVLVLYGCRAPADDLSVGAPVDGDAEIVRAFSSTGARVTDLLKSDLARIGRFLREGDVFVCGSRPVQQSILALLRALPNGGRLFFDDWR